MIGTVNSKIACAGAFALSLAAFGGNVYTWTGGGEAGKWSDVANWSLAEGEVTAAPNAGDVAVFDADATIIENFSIGEGFLVLTNAASKKLYFNCVISGAGGIQKGGDGELHMMKDNEFTGKLISTGTRDLDKEYGFSSEVYMYEPYSLGKTGAEFDQDYWAGHGSRLVIKKAMTVPIPLKLTGDRKQQGMINFACGNNSEVIFAEEVYDPFRWNDATPGNFTVRFKKGVTGISNYFIMNGRTYIFEGPISAGTFYVQTDKQIHLACSNCLSGVSSFSPSSVDTTGIRVFCDVTNALSKGVGKSLTLPFSKEMWIDLCGNDQTPAGGISIGSQKATAASNYGFTSATPAMLRVITASSSTFGGKFEGYAGLEFTPPAGSSSGWCFTNAVSTTRGTVKIGRNAVRIKDGAGFSRLGKLEVGAEGSFLMDSDAGAFFAGVVEIAEGGKLSIGAGKMMECSIAFTNGVALATGTYTKDNLSAVISGDGELHVGTFTYTGGKNSDWNDAGNWEGGVTPAAGNFVLVSSGTAAIPSTTPVYKSFTVCAGATVVCSNWTTCVTAETVVVDGTIACAGPFRTETNAPAARVWIRCKNLTVSSSGAIDVQGKGWSGGANGVVGVFGKTYSGFGYGAALYFDDGAAHGGSGAMDQVSSGYGATSCYGHPNFGYEYDDPFAPELPGSGGAHNNSAGHRGGAGGGAVRVEAAGTVTVNGRICADAEKVADARFQSNGSGGSVWISCASFAGAGRVSAEGGSGYTCEAPTFVTVPHGSDNLGGLHTAGGGGMIRVECDSASVAGMKISAAPGYYAGTAQGKGRLTAATCDKWRTEADLGTVTFNNNLVLDQLLGNGLSGRLVGVSSYERSGDLSWTWGHVRFAGEGADVSVSGDLTISGEDSRLEVGGVSNGYRCAVFVTRCGGAELNKLTVGGNFTVADGAAFDVRAAATNSTMRWGGEVDVKGDFTVGANAIVRPWCDPLNLGASHFVVGGSFTVAANGLVDASRAGGAPYYGAGSATVAQRGWLGQDHNRGWGLAGNTGDRGSAHAGKGGPGWTVQKDATTGAIEYDKAAGSGAAAYNYDEWTADYPGAGGGAGGYGDAGYGGGLVYVDAQGAVVVDGTIRADGWGGITAQSGSNTERYNYAMFGGGAGGGVHIFGATFAGGGFISAHGGEGAGRTIKGSDSSASVTNKLLSYSAGCGGGGAIAIVTGADKLSGDWRMHRSDSAAEKHVAKRYAFTGTFDVGGGTNVSIAVGEKFSLTNSWGGVGSVRYVNYATAPGTAVIVR